MTTTLDSVLTYTNTKLLKRYEKDYPNNALSSDEAFHEMLKYLWLCYQYSVEINHAERDASLLKFNCAMYKEMSDIDDMWHTFILHTNDYMNFCHNNFGYYMHHQPLEALSPSEVTLDEEALNYYLHFIYDRLGGATVKKWFQWKDSEHNSLSNISNGTSQSANRLG